MSVIAAHVTEDIITFVADTQITQGWRKFTEYGRKILITPSAVVAFAGTSCYASIITDVFKRRLLAEHSDAELLDIIDEIRESAAIRGLVYSDEESNSITLLIASKNRVTTIYGYTIFDVTDTTAIGAGYEVCHALMDTGSDIFDAIKYTCKHNIYCAPPYEVVELHRKTGHVYVDILDDNRQPIEDSYSSKIDYAAPREEEEDDIFDASPDYQITVHNVHTPQRHNDQEPIIF